MGAKDCVFTISFLLTSILSILYIVAFASEQWVHYTLVIGGHTEEGSYGLWKKCKTNVTTDKYTCSHSHLAQGPDFLEVSRVTACVGAVFLIGSIFGYIVSDDKEDTSKCAGKIKFRLQELSALIAGIMGIISAATHMKNSEEHYKEDLGTEDVSTGAFAIVMLVTGCLKFVNSVIMWCTRPCPPPPTTKRTQAPKIIVEIKNEAESRKKWLSKATIPTPVEQKEKMDLTPSQKTHGAEDDNKAGDVEVKKGWSRSIVAPTQVILAIKRLSRGEKRQSENMTKSAMIVEEGTAPKDSAPLQDDPSNKYKGIFTVTVDNKSKEKSGPAPPAPPPVLATPRRRADSYTSTSSSSSGISVEAVHTGKKMKKPAKGGASTLARPTPVVRHFSQNEADIRARAQQAAVIVTDEASVKVAQERSRPGISKRHVTHQETTLRNTVELATSSGGNKLNIYHIPEDPGVAGALPPPPSYEAVVDKK